MRFGTNHMLTCIHTVYSTETDQNKHSVEICEQDRYLHSAEKHLGLSSVPVTFLQKRLFIYCGSSPFPTDSIHIPIMVNTCVQKKKKNPKQIKFIDNSVSVNYIKDVVFVL